MDHGWLLTERQLEAMAKRGMWLCPTVGVLTHPAGTLEHFPGAPKREDARRRSESACRSWPGPMRCTENWPILKVRMLPMQSRWFRYRRET